MNCLVRPDGRIDFGIIDSPVENVNFKDYRLETPMGRIRSRLWKTFRFHQFVFIGILGPDVFSGLAIVDLKYLSNGFFYVYDTSSKTLHETKVMDLPIRARIGTNPSSPDARIKTKHLSMTIQNNIIKANAPGMALDAALNHPTMNPLRICTRTGYKGWTYTEKTSPISLSGTLTCQGKSWDLSSPHVMALSDWTAGFMRRSTFWNWAASSWVLPDERRLGFNLSSGVNETGFTENFFQLDNERIKVDTMDFRLNPDNLMSPWKIRSFDKKVDLEFIPEHKREENVNTWVVASRFTQIMGHFQGTLTTDSGEKITLCDIPGFTEDHYAKI